jgi:hypothetical protein
LHAACRSACAAAGFEQAGDVHTLRHTFATHLWRAGRTCASFRSCSATPASQARRATPGSGSAWKSCHPAERVPWLRLWRWRISSVAMAKRFDRRRRATHHGRHHGVPDGGARGPRRAGR